jgi:hypothetical protein
MVKHRFEEKLEGAEGDLALALELAKFSVDDLLMVHQNLVELFPPKYDIFVFLQKEYKLYVEKLISPYLEDLTSLKENPGNIIIFLSWLDGYESLLKRAGVFHNDYADLKEVSLYFYITDLTQESPRLYVVLHEPYRESADRLDKKNVGDERRRQANRCTHQSPQ